jgi:hypothetical protein
LESLTTFGILTTIRDIGGNISYEKPIIVSTVSGVSFHDGSSSFNLTVPFDAATFQPKSKTTYELLNTIGFTQKLTTTFASSFNAQYIIGNSSIYQDFRFENLDSVSNLFVEQSTIFHGPLVLEGNLTVSSPMTYITDLSASFTTTDVIVSRNAETLSATANTINVNTFDTVSSAITVGNTFSAYGNILALSSFTTASNANVLQAGILNVLVLSTGKTVGGLVVQNTIFLPEICSLSTYAKEFITDSLYTTSLNILGTLSTGAINPIISYVSTASISTVSTGILTARSISANYLQYDLLATSSFGLMDKVTNTGTKVWARNNKLYYGLTPINYSGEELPDLPSSITGLGTLGYLSSSELLISGFSTHKIYSQKTSTLVINTPNVTISFLSTSVINANSLLASNSKINAVESSSIKAYTSRVNLLKVNEVQELNVTTSSLKNTNSDTSFLDTKSANVSRLTATSVSAKSLNTTTIHSEIFTTSLMPTNRVSSVNIDGDALFTNTVIGSNLDTLNITVLSTISIKDVSVQNITSSLQTNAVVFNDGSRSPSLFFSSGVFYSDNKPVPTENNIDSLLTSTVNSLGSLKYLSSSKWLPSGLSSKQVLANQIYSSSLSDVILNIDTLRGSMISVNTQIQSTVNTPFLHPSSFTSVNARFSTLRVTNLATQNLVLNRGSIVGTSYVFTNLSSGQATISTFSTTSLSTVSIIARTTNASSISTNLTVSYRTTTHVLDGGENITLSNLNTPIVTARDADTQDVSVKSFTTPFLQANTLITQPSSLLITKNIINNISTSFVRIQNSAIVFMNTESSETSSLYISSVVFNTDVGPNVLMYSSNTNIYMNSTLILRSDVQNRSFISTIGGLSQLGYVNSYGFDKYLAISANQIYVNMTSSLNLTTNIFSTITNVNTALSAVSAGIHTLNSQTMDPISSLVIRTLSNTIDYTNTLVTDTFSSAVLNTDLINIKYANIKNTVFTYQLSSINIGVRSLSSISLDTFLLQVSTLTANTMATNSVSTATLLVNSINVASTFITLPISSGLTAVNSLTAGTLSSITTSFQSAITSNTQSFYISTNLLSTASIYPSNMSYTSNTISSYVVSTLSLNTFEFTASSSVLYINSVPLADFTSIQATVTSTATGLASISYLSTYFTFMISSPQVLASSISTGTLISYATLLDALEASYIYNRNLTTSTLNSLFMTTSSITLFNGITNTAFIHSLTSYLTSASNTMIVSGSFSSIQTLNANITTLNVLDLYAQNALTQNIGIQSSIVSEASTNQTSVESVLKTNRLLAPSLSAAMVSTFHFSTSQASASSILTDQVNTDSLSVLYGNFSSIYANTTVNSVSISPSTISVNTVSTSHLFIQDKNVSSLTTNSLQTSGLSVDFLSTYQIHSQELQYSNIALSYLSVERLFTSILSSQTTSTYSIVTSSLVSQTTAFSSFLVSSNINTNSIYTSSPYVSSINFLGNQFVYSEPYLYLNGTNITTDKDITSIFVSTGLLQGGLISSLIGVNADSIFASTISILSSVTLNTSAVIQSSIRASSLVLPYLGILAQSNSLSLNSLLTLFSSQVTIGPSPQDTYMYVSGSVRAYTLTAPMVSVSSIQSNTFEYTSLTSPSIVSYSTLTVQGSVKVGPSLQLSSIGNTSTILLGADNYNIFYGTNTSTFIPVLFSTFTSSITSFAANGSVYVAGGKSIPSFWGHSSIGSDSLAYSIDGIRWSSLGLQGFTRGVNYVTWQTNSFYAVGEGTTTIARSEDGIVWQPLASNIFTNCKSLVQGRNGYVAVGSGSNTTAFSPDGITWSGTGSTILTGSANTVATNGSVFVAGGYGAEAIATSVDGISWQRYAGSTITQEVKEIAYNGLQFVAVGSEGIHTSPDGYVWSAVASPIARGNSVSWNGSNWLVTDRSTIYYSKDTRTWASPLSQDPLVSTFSYTGISTIITPPLGTSYIKIQMWGAGGAGGASTFEPYYLNNLQLWLDADDPNTIVTNTNTSTVNFWLDKSPIHQTVSTVYVQGPDYYSTFVNFTNSTFLTTDTISSSAYTLNFLGKITSTNTSLVCSINTCLAVSSGYLTWQGVTTNQQVSTNSSILVSVTTTLSTLTWRINGASNTSADGSYRSTLGLTIGGGLQLNELLYFNSNLLSHTQEDIEGYLAWKWSVQSLLPSYHPYKNNFSSIQSGGGGAYVEGYFPLQIGSASTFALFIGNGGAFNASTSAKGAYLDPQGKVYFSTSGGVSYDAQYGNFKPNFFSSLGLWLDGADPLGTGIPPSNGTSIPTWTDKSSSNRSAQAVGGTGYYNGGYMEFSSSAYEINYQNFKSTSYTIFSVQLLASNTGNYQTLLSGGDLTPSLFSGVLSNSIATFTGNGSYNDTTANIPLIDGTSWHLVDMLVANSVLQPFVDGSSQNSKVGFTGSFSTLFLGALSPRLQNYVGVNQSISVYDSILPPPYSTLTQASMEPSFLSVYDNDSISTIALSQTFFDTLLIYDPSVGIESLPQVQNNYGNNQTISVYDSIASAPFSTLLQTAVLPTLLNVYDTISVSTLILAQSFFETLVIYDPSVGTDRPPQILSNYDTDQTISVYDSIALGPFSTLLQTAALPTLLSVYDTVSVSTLTLSRSLINTLQTYDTSVGSQSSFTIYKPDIGITSWQGKVGEILCFDSALSKQERQIVEGYLASKWGLQQNLPINHPYRLSNIYTNPPIKGLGGGGAASGLLLPNGQVLIAAGGGGGGQGTLWGGGAGGLDVGQRGSITDGCNSFGYSPYSYQNGPYGAGGGSNGQGGQGAYASNGAQGGTGILGKGGSGGVDGWHLALPGGGGGGGYYGGGGGALANSSGGGNSLWKTVGGFLPNFSYSKPGYGRGDGNGQGGVNTMAGSDGRIVITFLSSLSANPVTALQYRASQTLGFGQINLQSGLPLYNSTLVLQAFQSTLVLNNTMFVDGTTNRVSIKTNPTSAVSLMVNGFLSKTAGSFVINNPVKPGYKLRHSFVESPTSGDTLYKWMFSTVDCKFEYKLPSWFSYLNANPQVWVQAMDFETDGRGYVRDGVLRLETTADGLFEVLCVATRKDIEPIDVEYRQVPK